MLRAKQKKYLMAMAVHLRPFFQVGKGELSASFLCMVDRALEKHELLKIKVLKTAGKGVKELAFDIAENTESEIVQEIGRVIILYRRSSKNPTLQLP